MFDTTFNQFAGYILGYFNRFHDASTAQQLNQGQSGLVAKVTTFF